jgi:hypothetical protein
VFAKDRAIAYCITECYLFALYRNLCVCQGTSHCLLLHHQMLSFCLVGNLGVCQGSSHCLLHPRRFHVCQVLCVRILRRGKIIFSTEKNHVFVVLTSRRLKNHIFLPRMRALIFFSYRTVLFHPL